MSLNKGVGFFDVLFDSKSKGKVYLDCFVSKEDIKKTRKMKNIKIVSFFNDIRNKRTGQIKEKYKNCLLIVKEINFYGMNGSFEILRYNIFNIEENENEVLKENLLFSISHPLFVHDEIKKDILKAISFYFYKETM